MSDSLEPEAGFPAVWIRGLNKSYGRFSNKLLVLNNLNMTVPQGCIYGLLGPSGAGKTTLLKLIVGRLRPDKGKVIVLGDSPGALGHDIPGALVGYMPQETALYMELTIGETLKYFGRIHGMTSSQIIHRTVFLLDFLSLPGKNKKIGHLSGGQMRRVSLAAALLQEPQLLILDEPTVGVDPLLREKIWEHLLEIAQKNQTHKTTIIITTHYVEEARQADVVGLMRGGRLLAEDAPNKLMQLHNQPTLEGVFLQLCHQDILLNEKEEEEEEEGSWVSQSPHNSASVEVSVNTASAQPEAGKQRDLQCSSCHRRGPAMCDRCQNSFKYQPLVQVSSGRACCACCNTSHIMRHIYAQVMKNLTIMMRNIGFLLFEFCLPTFQIVLFCLCIGHKPYDLPIGVYSEDQGGSFHGFPVNISQMIIQYLDNTTLKQSHYSNLSGALADVQSGTSWGVIYFERNYSNAVITRYSSPSPGPLSNSTLEASKIHLFMDMTNQQVALTIQETVIDAISTFATKVFPLFQVDPDELQIPVEVETPVYGEINPSFTNFMAPGVILSIAFFMATGLTSIAFVVEKKEGLMERCLVAGVTSFEIMISHVLTQLLVMAGQVALLLVFALAVFNVPYNGPLIIVILLVFLQGLCGMTLGIIFSSVADREVSAMQLALGSVYPQLLLSGIIWPVEGMPPWLRQITYLLPMTYGAQAMRSILSRGWGLEHMLVWRGFLVTIGWSAGLILLSTIIVRLKQ